MCGRSSLTKTEKELEERFNATFYSDALVNYNPLPNFNVAPSHYHPVITQQDSQLYQYFRWGLIPPWAKDPNIGYKMINARIETVLEKSSFKHPVKQQRCIIPIDGFYEWKKEGKTKTPFRIIPTNVEVVFLAGIYSTWVNPDGKSVHTYSILTQEANTAINHIHDRMPAMLLPEQEEHWIDPAIPIRDLLEMIQPYPEEFTDYYEVSSRVNKVSNNDEDLIQRFEDNSPKQLNLF